MLFDDVEYPAIYLYGKDIPMDDPPFMMIIISTTIGFALLFTKLLQYFINLHIPHKLPIVVLVIIFVSVQKKYTYLQRIVWKCTLDNPIELYLLYLPIFLLRSAFTINKKRFFLLLPVSLTLSFVPMVSGFIQAAIMRPIMDSSWSYLDCVTFNVMFMTVQPFFLVNLLKSTDKYKNAVPLLRAYTILSNVWCGIMLQFVTMYYNNQLQTWSDPVISLIKNLIASNVVGFILAKFATLALIIFIWDVTASITILLSSLIIGFRISNLFGFSEFLTCLIIGWVIIYDKDRFSTDTEKYIFAFFEFLGTLVDMSLYIYCCFMITAFCEPFDFSQIYLLAFNYVSLIMVRCALLLLLYPLVKRMRKVLTFGNVLVLAWGSTVGNMALIACLELHDKMHAKHIALTAMPFLLFSAVAGAIINNTGVSIILRTLNSNLVTQTMIQSIVFKMNYLLDERNNYIEVLKMNRRLSDVNWSYVKQLTTIRLPPPFPKNMEITGSKAEDVKICCNVCPYDITLSMSPKKIIQFKKELNKNLIYEMKAILVRQHEFGLISLEVSNALIRDSHIYLSLEVPTTKKLEYINKFFKKNALLVVAIKWDKLGFTSFKHVLLKPRKPFNRFCYHMYRHKAFKMLTYLVICWCAAEPIVTAISLEAFFKFGHAAFICFHVVTVFFIFEFIITIMSYSWKFKRFFKGGLAIYFSSTWNCIQFVALLLMFVELYIGYAHHEEYMAEERDDPSYQYFYYSRFLRFLRFFQVMIGIIPRIATMLNTQADLSIAFGYELAKALKECQDELLITIDRVVENSEMREHFMTKISTERMTLFTFILNLEMEIPWLAPTVKTRQLINSTRCAMISALQKMKYSGSVEGLEYNQILSVIVGKNRGLKILTKIQPITGLSLFDSVAWIDRYTLEELYSHIQIEVFRKGRDICKEGTILKGVYLVMSGLLKLRYHPSEEVVENLIQNGKLPIIDYLNTTNVEKTITEYIIPGNTIGELSLLTGAPYDCTITAETDVKMYVMKKKYLKQAFLQQPDKITGVESRMWKYSTINLATAILMSTTAYQFNTLREIRSKLQRSFVPDLQQYKIFVVTNLMEDIILLEGVVVDFFARDVYTAPCYLPRSVIKLCLAKCSFFNQNSPISTKLMIIPVPGISIEDIMSREERLAEFLPETSSRKFGVHPSTVTSKGRKEEKPRKILYDSALEVNLKRMEEFDKSDSDSTKKLRYESS